MRYRYLQHLIFVPAVLPMLVMSGCAQWYAADAEREVSRLIDQRQMQALGIRSDASAGEPTGPPRAGSEAYAFAPHPSDPSVPESFAQSDTPLPEEEAAATQPAEGQEPTEPLVMGFADVIKYAFRHDREFQGRKEDLYLSALALTLERFLWTPQFTAELESNFAHFGQIRDFDNAMDAIARVAAEQRLPLGGRVTAEIISTFMRDLGQSITSGESSELILSAEIPLLRGAGLVALEDRFQVERSLIYAVREFERERRTLFVEVASEYLDLLVGKKLLENAEFSVASFESDFERAKALNDAGRESILEVQRAEQALLQNRILVVDTRAAYETNLDRFKIGIGMPVSQPLVIRDVELEIPIPRVGEKIAVETALQYRLDLLTEVDRVGDAKRAARNAANSLLPDLNLTGSARFNTDPNETNVYSFEDERVTWRAGALLDLPVNRQRERNDYRRSLIELRRAERQFDLSTDEVRQDVRAAIREFFQAKRNLEIGRLNIDLAEYRREAAAISFELGRVGNRDKVEAEDALRDARDSFARNLSDFQTAILRFWLATGTLRLNDDGLWLEIANAAE